MAQDRLYRYIFEDLSIRGELVQIDKTFKNIIDNHNYPKPIEEILGQLVVATSLLTATLKFKGSITVQLQGNGPVELAVINGTHLQQLRGIARFNNEVKDNMSLKELFGDGVLVITITPEQGDRYQGIVAIEHDSIAEVLETYFAQSEQLQTKIWLRQDNKQAAGMLIQVLPSGEFEPENFSHLTQLTNTIKNSELFTLSGEDILYRLYHQETVKLFEPQNIEFQCSCSKERCESALLTLNEDELKTLLEKDEGISMHCDYCGSNYCFTKEDILNLKRVIH